MAQNNIQQQVPDADGKIDWHDYQAIAEEQKRTGLLSIFSLDQRSQDIVINKRQKSELCLHIISN